MQSRPNPEARVEALALESATVTIPLSGLITATLISLNLWAAIAWIAWGFFR